jgi:hypothetical protein
MLSGKQIINTAKEIYSSIPLEIRKSVEKCLIDYATRPRYHGKSAGMDKIIEGINEVTEELIE